MSLFALKGCVHPIVPHIEHHEFLWSLLISGIKKEPLGTCKTRCDVNIRANLNSWLDLLPENQILYCSGTWWIVVLTFSGSNINSYRIQMFIRELPHAVTDIAVFMEQVQHYSTSCQLVFWKATLCYSTNFSGLISSESSGTWFPLAPFIRF